MFNKVPTEIYILAIPTTYAVGAFTGLIYKTLSSDPEMSKITYYDRDEREVIKHAAAWNNSVAMFFRERIRNRNWGVFNNE